jgi:hypothetical protein
MREKFMNEAKDNSTLPIRPRPVEPVTIQIPKDALESLKKVAHSRDMSVDALLKFYIGQALRQDVAQLFSERVLETTAQVLARHLQSEEEVSTILREIRYEVA